MVPRWGGAHARFGGGSASNGLRDHRGPIRWMVGRRAGWLADWEVSDLTLNGSLNLNGSRILENGLELPANASAGTNVGATRPGVGPQAGCESTSHGRPFRCLIGSQGPGCPCTIIPGCGRMRPIQMPHGWRSPWMMEPHGRGSSPRVATMGRMVPGMAHRLG